MIVRDYNIITGNSTETTGPQKNFRIRVNNNHNSKLFKYDKVNKTNSKNYDNQIESKYNWIEKFNNKPSMVNCLSSNYDFIFNNGNTPLKYDTLKSKINEKINNKKKSISEITDLQRLYNPNFHPNYQEIYNNNNNNFKKSKAYCSKLIDKGYRNGSTYKLFYNYRL